MRFREKETDDRGTDNQEAATASIPSWMSSLFFFPTFFSFCAAMAVVLCAALLACTRTHNNHNRSAGVSVYAGQWLGGWLKIADSSCQLRYGHVAIIFSRAMPRGNVVCDCGIREARVG